MTGAAPYPLNPPQVNLHPALTLGVRKSLVHHLALWLVGLTVISGAFVFAEPAPVDVLTMGLIVGLPLIGLTHFNAGLKFFFAIWMVIAGCHMASVMMSSYTGDAFIHVVVSIYLFLAAVIFAAFIARRPRQHAQLILDTYTVAAVIATLAALVGYFSIIPGANELFTKYGRASGPFKDPNVFGAFIIPALIYALHGILNTLSWRKIVMSGVFGLLALSVLLSFSRGAWVASLIAIVIYLLLSFLTAKYQRQQVHLVALVFLGGILATLAVVMAAQTDAIGNLLTERAQLTQAYDEGHEGRFGGQTKAFNLIALNPFGIGALEFAETYHSEEVHNVYLTVFLKAGWLGGGLYLILILATVGFGLRHAFRRTASQPLFIVAYAALVAIILEGLLIDTDHWRHFYLLMAIVWGLMLSDRKFLRARRIISEVPGRPMQLTGLTKLPSALPAPKRIARIQSYPAQASALYDVRGYTAYAHRAPRLIRALH